LDGESFIHSHWVDKPHLHQFHFERIKKNSHFFSKRIYKPTNPLPSFANPLPSSMVPSLQHHCDSSGNSRKLTIVLGLTAQDSIMSTPSPPTKISIMSTPLPALAQASKALAHLCSSSLSFFFLLLSSSKQRQTNVHHHLLLPIPQL